LYASTNFCTGGVCALRDKTLGRRCWSLSASARRGSVTRRSFVDAELQGARAAARRSRSVWALRVAMVGGSLTLVV
jgi:hypothetical protein